MFQFNGKRRQTIAKVPRPSQPTDYRPISVTPVMSRMLEKCVVRRYIYPALTRPPPQLNFDDQFAFRPTGSTTAAIIALLHTVRSLLSINAICARHSLRFFEGFWYCPPRDDDEQDGVLGTSGQHLQLVSQFLHLSTSLHAVCSNHGISDTSLHDVFRATIVGKLTYAAPAWSGACSAGDRAKLDAFGKRCRRLGFGYCSQNEPSLTQLMDDADERLFRSIMNNSEHVLQPFLPDRPVLSYNLRRRSHCNKSL